MCCSHDLPVFIVHSSALTASRLFSDGCALHTLCYYAQTSVLVLVEKGTKALLQWIALSLSPWTIAGQLLSERELCQDYNGEWNPSALLPYNNY